MHRDLPRNHWAWLMPANSDAQRAVDWACGLFSPDIQSRGIARMYYDSVWVLNEMSRAIPGGFKDKRVLDVGAGAGLLSLAMHHLGADVAALDRFDEYDDQYDNQMGTTADIVKRLSENGVSTIQRDFVANGLPSDTTFDVVAMFGVIEHLHGSPRRVLADIAGSLKPGGHVVIETPNHAWLRTRLRLLRGKSANHPLSEWWQDTFFGHIREYTLPELRAMLEWSGFETSLATIGNWAHMASRVRASSAGDVDRWTTRFTLNSVERVMVASSNCVTALIPSLRYSALVIGRKP